MSGYAGKGRCRSCRADVLWVHMMCLGVASSKPSPVDCAPSIDGNIEVKSGKKSNKLYGRVLNRPGRESARAVGTSLFVSHFATCPQADDWRKRANDS